MFRTILVDDERPALNALLHLLKEYPDLEIAGAFTGIDQAMEFIHADGRIDLVFLDIDMPKMNGIDAAREIHTIRNNIEIIFVTAYQHFAVEAFEINAIDYVMKPVSRKRLDKTLERMMKKRLDSKEPSWQQKRSDFLNALVSEVLTDRGEIGITAKSLGLEFTKPFSLYFVLINDVNQQPVWKDPQRFASLLTKINLKLANEPGLVPWKNESGIAILDFNIPAVHLNKEAETAKVVKLKKKIETCIPGYSIYIGIAGPNASPHSIRDRFLQARNSAMIGKRINPELGIYHFSDSGFLPLIDQYLDSKTIALLIENTIGKILEHDRKNGAELFRTMEKLIVCNNLQEVADHLFIHYKTVTFRKQNIEKILGFTLNSFTGRTTLGMALTFHYLQEIPPLNNDVTDS